MSVTEELLSRALQLPEAERAVLTRCLLLSLEPETFDEDSAAAWDAELEARLARVDQGPFTARDWREALAHIRQSLVNLIY
jgi:putative addiction module component (TIGR02574 family)